MTLLEQAVSNLVYNAVRHNKVGGHVAVILEADEVRALQARCAPGLSVNDLLVSAVARVSAGRTSKGPVVVLYTMDLRRFSGRAHLSATNASSILTAVVPRDATGELGSTAVAVRAITARLVNRAVRSLASGASQRL